MSPAEMAELIKMPFGMLSRLGTESHVLDGVHIGTTNTIQYTANTIEQTTIGTNADCHYHYCNNFFKSGNIKCECVCIIFAHFQKLNILT